MCAETLFAFEISLLIAERLASACFGGMATALSSVRISVAPTITQYRSASSEE